MIERGLIQVYTGDGKGKTTAVLGQIVRALGHGCRAALVQFMKGSSYYGELATLERLGDSVAVFQYGRVCAHNSLIKQGDSDCLACGNCFVVKGKATDFDRLYTSMAMERSKLLVAGGQYDVVVLDEILNAVYFDLVGEGDILDLAATKPGHVELIMTGRNAGKAVVEMADLVTEMKKVKHPFDRGIQARRGIEY